MNPTVSICIPTFNGEQYLDDCLQSILAQEFENFEVLIVDDHSTDETIPIIQSYIAQDKRIRLEKNPFNLGLVGNWNRCLELAQGEWIKFVFQDDLIEPDCLKTFLAARHPNCPIIYCRRNFIFEAGVSTQVQRDYTNYLSIVNQVFAGLTYISAKKYGEAVLDFMPKIGFNLVGEPTTVMLHRSIFPNFGQFNPYMIQNSDEEFWTRIAVNTGLIYVEESLASFRLHNRSASHKHHQRQYYQISMIDPILRLHDMVLEPVYEPLRQLASQRSPSINLMRLLKWQAYKARWKAQLHPNKNLMKEWKNAVTVYPNLLQFSTHRALLEEVCQYFS